jgi:Fur family peroxide stress response transcriptional regulator
MQPRQDDIAARQEAFQQALRADGLRITKQRLEIIREVAGAYDHPDADLVFRRVRERLPRLSQDTVYRTLDVLATRGLVERVPMPRATRFDPCGAPHHHFICDRCGALVDVPLGLLSSLSPVPEALEGVGHVRSAHLLIHGLCEVCSNATADSLSQEDQSHEGENHGNNR